MGAATAPLAIPQSALVAAALWETLASSSPASENGGNGKPFNPWLRAGTNGALGVARRVRYNEGLVTVTPAADGAGYHVAVDDQPYADGAPIAAALDGRTNRLTLRVAGQQENYFLARRGYETLVSSHGASYTLARPRPLTVESATHSAEAASGTQTLVAPMAGTIIKVNVAEGDTVAERQTLVVLGAMKMEHAIVAPYAGTVRSVRFAAGDVVPGGEALVTLETLDA
jgi:3-methylcrotonyl-CoA carboxylase alpha subunit